MKKFLYILLGVSIALVGFIAFIAHAQSNPNFWLLSGGNLKPIGGTWGLSLPSTPCTGSQYYQSTAGGVFQCGTPAGGSSGVSTSSINQIAIYNSSNTVIGYASGTYNSSTDVWTLSNLHVSNNFNSSGTITLNGVNVLTTSTFNATGTAGYFPYWGPNGNTLTQTSNLYQNSTTNNITVASTTDFGSIFGVNGNVFVTTSTPQVIASTSVATSTATFGVYAGSTSSTMGGGFFRAYGSTFSVGAPLAQAVAFGADTAAGSKGIVIFGNSANTSGGSGFIDINGGGYGTAGVNLNLTSSTSAFLNIPVTVSTTLTVNQTSSLLGNVGVGTSSPKSLLDVEGSNITGWFGVSTSTAPDANSISRFIVGDSVSSNPGYLYLVAKDTNSGDNVGGVAFSNYAVAAAEKRMALITGFLDGGSTSGGIYFYTNNAGTLAQRMTLKANGNLGLDTVAGTAVNTFDVTGSGDFSSKLAVGTTNTTTATLNVVGTASVSQTSTVLGQFNITTNPGASTGQLDFQDTDVSSSFNSNPITMSHKDGSSSGALSAIGFNAYIATTPNLVSTTYSGWLIENSQTNGATGTPLKFEYVDVASTSQANEFQISNTSTQVVNNVLIDGSGNKYVTSTAASLAGTYLGTSGSQLTVSSTLASSSYKFTLINATTTASTTNYNEWKTDQQVLITNLLCKDTVGTTTLNIFIPTSYATTTVSSTIAGSFSCGTASNSSSTNLTLAAATPIIVEVSSTAGTPVSTPIQIFYTKQ